MSDERLGRLVEAVQAMAGDLGLEAVLQRIVEAARDLVDAGYAAIGVIDHGSPAALADEQPFLSNFVHAGMTDAVVASIGNLPQGHGILGLLIEHPVAIRLEDLTKHPASVGFPPEHPPMGTFVGAPVRVHGQVFGNLYLTEKAGGAQFTAQDQELVEALAAVAGSAISNAELFAQVQRLTLIEDRERIGRELHDTVIQRLFATGLSLQALARRCEVENPDAAQRVATAVDDLDETIREIRAAIFSLQDTAAQAGMRNRVAGLCRELGPMLGFTPNLVFRGPVDLLASPSLTGQLLRVLRESITNVARHARASSVVVEVSATPEALTLTVKDDGVGMPARLRDDALGLSNLEHRAQELGGSFTAQSRADDGAKGTVVEWSVPL